MISATITRHRSWEPVPAVVKAFSRLDVRPFDVHGKLALPLPRRYNNMSAMAADQMLMIVSGVQTATTPLARDKVNLRLADGPNGQGVGPEWIFGATGGPVGGLPEKVSPSAASTWTFQDTGGDAYTCRHVEVWVGDGSQGEQQLRTTGYKFSDVSLGGVIAKDAGTTLLFDWSLELYSESAAFQSQAMRILLDMVTGASTAYLTDSHLVMRPLSNTLAELPGADLPPDVPLSPPDTARNAVQRWFTAGPGIFTGDWAQILLKHVGADGIKRPFWQAPAQADGREGGDKAAGSGDRWAWEMRLHEGESSCPTIRDFRATPTTINRGEAVTLHVLADSAPDMEIDQGVGAVTSGSIVVRPQQTGRLTYTLTARNAGCDPVTSQLEIEVQGKPVISQLEADPNPVSAGTATTVRYKVTGANADGISVDQGVGLLHGASGSFQFTPQTDTTLTMSARNDAGVTQKTVFIDTVSEPVVRQFGVSTASSDVPTVLGSATEAAAPTFRIAPGSRVKLHWQTTGTDVSNRINGVGQNLAASGTAIVAPTARTVYELIAANQSGTAKSYIIVDVTSDPTVSIRSSAPSVRCGQPATITWSSENADVVDIPGIGSGLATSGSESVVINSRTTFTASAYRAAAPTKKATATVTVGCVGDPPDPRITSYTVRTGDQARGTGTASIEVAPGTTLHLEAVVNTGGFLPYPRITPLTTVNGIPVTGTSFLAAVDRIDETSMRLTAEVSPTVATRYRLDVSVPGAGAATDTVTVTMVAGPPTINCPAIKNVSSRVVGSDGSVVLSFPPGCFSENVTDAEVTWGSSSRTIKKSADTQEVVSVTIQGITTDTDFTVTASTATDESVTCVVSVRRRPEIRSLEVWPGLQKPTSGLSSDISVNAGDRFSLGWWFLGVESGTLRTTTPAGVTTEETVSGPRGTKALTAPAAVGRYRYVLSLTRGDVTITDQVSVTVTAKAKPTWGTFEGAPSGSSSWSSDTVSVPNGQAGVQVRWSGVSNYSHMVVTLSAVIGSSAITRTIAIADGTNTTFNPIGSSRYITATPWNGDPTVTGSVAGDPQRVDVDVGTIIGSIKIGSFVASPASVSPGSPIKFTWTITKGRPGRYLIHDSRGQTVYRAANTGQTSVTLRPGPTSDEVYTLIATGTNVRDSATVAVDVVLKPIVTVIASPAELDQPGDTVTVTWNIEIPTGGDQPTYIGVSDGGAFQTTTKLRGTKTYTPATAGTKTYTVRATNTDGTSEGSDEVIVSQAPPGNGNGPG